MEEENKRRKLSELKPGEVCVVDRYENAGNEAVALEEMGLLPGTKVRYIRAAPMGDPLEIELRFCKLDCLREYFEAGKDAIPKYPPRIP